MSTPDDEAATAFRERIKDLLSSPYMTTREKMLVLATASLLLPACKIGCMSDYTLTLQEAAYHLQQMEPPR